MERSSSDQLDLKGLQQIEAAWYALSATGANPIERERIRTLYEYHLAYQAQHPDAPEEIEISAQGPTIATLKADIIRGLEYLSTQAETIERKIASQALLEVMRA